MNLPKLDDIVAMTRDVVLPAFASSAVTFGLIRLIGRKRAGLIAGALAVVVGVAVGNNLHGTIDMPNGRNRALLWLPLAGVIAELVARLPGMSAGFGWVLRSLVAYTAAWFLVPESITNLAFFYLPTFAAVMLALWGLGRELTERLPGSEVPLALGYVMCTQSWVLLYASHYTTMIDLSLIMGSAVLGVAALAWAGKNDAGGVVPVVAIMVPGLLLQAYEQVENNFLLASLGFVLLAPLLLSLLLHPRVGKPTERRIAVVRSLLVVVVPMVIAALLAMIYEVQEP